MVENGVYFFVIIKKMAFEPNMKDSSG